MPITLANAVLRGRFDDISANINRSVAVPRRGIGIERRDRKFGYVKFNCAWLARLLIRDYTAPERSYACHLALRAQDWGLRA